MATGGVDVLVDAEAVRGDVGRGLVDIGHRDTDQLHIRAAVAVIRRDLDLVDTVTVGVGEGLEVPGRVERQHATGGDAEQTLVGATREREGRRVATVRIRRSDRHDTGLVLGRIHRIAAGDAGRVVDPVDRDRGRRQHRLVAGHAVIDVDRDIRVETAR